MILITMLQPVSNDQKSNFSSIFRVSAFRVLPTMLTQPSPDFSRCSQSSLSGQRSETGRPSSGEAQGRYNFRERRGSISSRLLESIPVAGYSRVTLGLVVRRTSQCDFETVGGGDSPHAQWTWVLEASVQTGQRFRLSTSQEFLKVMALSYVRVPEPTSSFRQPGLTRRRSCNSALGKPRKRLLRAITDDGPDLLKLRHVASTHP